MREEIAARTRTAMTDAGLDAIIAISPENFTYLSGFVVPSQAELRWRHAAVVLTADGGDGMLCVDMEETTVRSRAGETDIRVWGEFTDESMAVLADLLGDLGLDTARIGTEFDYLPAGDLRSLDQDSRGPQGVVEIDTVVLGPGREAGVEDHGASRCEKLAEARPSCCRRAHG